MTQYIMALDQGTTSSRCIIFNHSGEIVSVAQKEFTQYFPKPGWVEHDAEEIWETQYSVAKEALEKKNISAEQIAGIGITNQRETTVVWNKYTGKPIYHAIVWQCRRTADFCRTIDTNTNNSLIRERTGLRIDPYFSGTKLRWILENVPGARKEAEQGNLLFGTIETWLLWKLTEGRTHATDCSNAARTMLFDIHGLCWDKDILSLLDIPQSMLPEIRSNSEIYGETTLFGSAIPVCGMAGDQQAALFGQCCFESGEVKNTYGTGCFMLMNTGGQAVSSNNGLLTTVAWQLNGETTYALEGSVFIAGALIQWLRDGLQIIQKASESEGLALSVEDNGGVYTVPAFTGLGAPYWNADARGIITGITRGTTKAHIVRSALEALAYQVYDLLEAMEKDSGIDFSGLKADGGACANNFLMQFQADITGKAAERPMCIESTALGAAYLAGLAIGFWKSTDEIKSNRGIDKVFSPSMSQEKVNELLKGWKKAVSRVM